MFKLNRLIKRKARVFGIFTKMIAILEKTNEQFFKIRTDAIDKIREQEQIANDAQKHINENVKHIKKIQQIID